VASNINNGVISITNSDGTNGIGNDVIPGTISISAVSENDYILERLLVSIDGKDNVEVPFNNLTKKIYLYNTC
jgi:flagellar hook assembly protein FlgD